MQSLGTLDPELLVFTFVVFITFIEETAFRSVFLVHSSAYSWICCSWPGY